MDVTVVEELTLPKAFVYEGEAFVVGDIEIDSSLPVLRVTVTDAWGKNPVLVMLDTAFLNKRDLHAHGYTPFEIHLAHAARRIVVGRNGNTNG